MPKVDIDYSNTIIYKIYCKDDNIKELYIGHTTNFIQRKYSHKIACNNLNNTQKIYNIIRSNGGWENWDMIEIAKYCCKDATEARIKEQYHYDELKSSLNSVPAYIDKTLYFCSKCNLQCSSPNQYNAHILSQKHIKNDSADNYENNTKTSKNIKKIICTDCDFSCFKKGDWNRHIMRPKHINISASNTSVTKDISNNNHICSICSKEYKSRNGLCNHKKKCNSTIENTDNNISNMDTNVESVLSDKEIIMALIKDINDFKNIIKSILKTDTNVT